MGKMKDYPLEVEVATEFEGGPQPMYYWSKGHHTPTAFCEAFAEYQQGCAETSYTAHIDFGPEEVKHEWQRCIPVGGHDPSFARALCYWPARGPGRGVYPVTVVYV